MSGAAHHAAADAPDPWLLERLVCPVSRRPLRFDPAASELVCDASGLAYPVVHGVPWLLAEAARPVNRPATSETDGSAAT